MKKNVLIASPSEEAVLRLREILRPRYHSVNPTSDLKSVLDTFRNGRFEFTFVDIACLESQQSLRTVADYKEILQNFWQSSPSAHLIIITPWERTREAVSAVKAGASTYLCYPFDGGEVDLVLDSLTDQTKLEWELAHFRRGAVGEAPTEGAVTRSSLMREALEKAKAVSPTRTTVLLTGETGCGKGVMAKLIHAGSNRADGPFIDVHCGAIPDTLLESEFFGHEKGAFTGAVRRKPGKFQIADGGTLFLDEIGTISAAAQIKMLQVLQEKSFTRVGGEELMRVDVRLIAATNCDLKKLCDQGSFREDLFYRLNVFPIEMPPLRHRTEDIPLLVNTFIERLNREGFKEIKGVDPKVMSALNRYTWPGNVRELENLVERAHILEKGSLLSMDSFPAELFALEPVESGPADQGLPTLDEARRNALEQFERRYLREVLVFHKGRIDQSAKTAGVTPRQLHNLMTKYNLRKEEFK